MRTAPAKIDSWRQRNTPPCPVITRRKNPRGLSGEVTGRVSDEEQKGWVAADIAVQQAPVIVGRLRAAHDCALKREFARRQRRTGCHGQCGHEFAQRAVRMFRHSWHESQARIGRRGFWNRTTTARRRGAGSAFLGSRKGRAHAWNISTEHGGGVKYEQE